MKILLVTHFFPPGHLGGTEILTFDLAKQLQAKGHEVLVLCGEGWDSAPDYKIQPVDEIYQGISVQRLHFNWTKAPDVFRFLYNNPEVFHHISELIEQFKPDILHITSCYTLSASIIDAAKKKSVPVLLSATDFWFLCARNTLLRTDDSLCPGPEDPWECAQCLMESTKFYQWSKNLLPQNLQLSLLKTTGKIPAITNQPGFRGMLGNWEERFEFLEKMLDKVDRIITANHFLRDKFIEFGVEPEKISFSSYGLDTSWARGFETKTPSNHLRLGFIGQILPFKGPQLLLKAIKAIPDENRIQVKIFGNLEKTPGFGEKLRQMAGNDPRIAFLGTFDNNLMGEVLSEIDYLVVPSTWYDFPLVIPSALATKTPVIGTNIPGINEQIQHNVNGFLFERYNWQALTNLILDIQENPSVTKQLRENIKPIKTTEEMAQEYINLYHSINDHL